MLGRVSARAIQRVLVFCASSTRCDARYHDAARRLGELLGEQSIQVVYGGGAVGSMGALAEGALARGGEVIGVIPHFMRELEWGHTGISALHTVNDMHERKRRMLEGSDAVVALPGGCGTFEELFEVITWKRLGIYLEPVVIVNTRRFFEPLIELLDRCISEQFMDERHRAMWQVVSEPEAVLGAIENSPAWSEESRSFAAL